MVYRSRATLVCPATCFQGRNAVVAEIEWSYDGLGVRVGKGVAVGMMGAVISNTSLNLE